MKLAALLEEITRAAGPVTGIDLAHRLGVEPQQVAAMLTALRASGHVVAGVRTGPSGDACASAGSCSMSCPGPAECSMTLDLNIGELEIRGR